MELPRGPGKAGSDGSQGLFSAEQEASRKGCRDSRAEGLATAKFGVGTLLERQPQATRDRHGRESQKRRQWDQWVGTTGTFVSTTGREWLGAGSGVGLHGFHFSSASLQVCGLRKIIHPL